MRGRIVKIGNSRGVRIPKALLQEAALTDNVEMTIVDGDLRISAVEPEIGNSLAAMSESALQDWARPEEDEAWAEL